MLNYDVYFDIIWSTLVEISFKISVTVTSNGCWETHARRSNKWICKHIYTWNVLKIQHYEKSLSCNCTFVIRTMYKNYEMYIMWLCSSTVLLQQQQQQQQWLRLSPSVQDQAFTEMLLCERAHLLLTINTEKTCSSIWTGLLWKCSVFAYPAFYLYTL